MKWKYRMNHVEHFKLVGFKKMEELLFYFDYFSTAWKSLIISVSKSYIIGDRHTLQNVLSCTEVFRMTLFSNDYG